MVCELVYTSGAGMSLLRADQRENCAGVAARHALQFAQRHVLRIAGYSALGAAEGNVDHRALPRHPGGQRLYLVESHLRVVADAALGGSAHRAVLNAISLKAMNVPVIHAHRHSHGQNPFGILDHLPNIVAEPHCVSGSIKVLQRNVIGVGCNCHSEHIFLLLTYSVRRALNTQANAARVKPQSEMESHQPSFTAPASDSLKSSRPRAKARWSISTHF